MKKWIAVAAMLATGLLLASEAEAINIPGLARVAKLGSYVPQRGPALAPMGHVVFCLKMPSECRRPIRPVTTVTLTRERERELRAVNIAVNRAIRPQNDRTENGLPDVWSLEPRSGDCEDYAITKRHRLMAAGWPSGALRLAVARTAHGEDHAVLVVRTDRGDLVLDNLTQEVRLWSATGLSWRAIQSAGDPHYWRRI